MRSLAPISSATCRGVRRRGSCAPSVDAGADILIRAIVPEPIANPGPSFEPIPAQKWGLPPSGELSTFLRAVTPSGAPALHRALSGLSYAAETYPLPLTRPSTPRPEWLRIELEALSFDRGNGHVPLKRDDIDHLIELLAPGPSRPDGLPLYMPHVWRWDRRRTKSGRRLGTARRVDAAVAFDLGDHDLIEVSAKVLSLHDKHGKTDKPKRARDEYRRHGRELLALLGVWPWTHAELGKLPKTWRTDAAFIDPLRLWQERAVAELEHEVARCRWAWQHGHALHRSDLLKVPPEGSARRPMLEQPEPAPVRLSAREIREHEEGIRALDALADKDDKRHTAREQARRNRRPVR